MKLKFEAFMRNSETKTKPVGIDTEKMELDINPELLKNILINLEKFEKNHKYLEKDMTMVKLAPALKTNPKYAAELPKYFSAVRFKCLDWLNYTLD